MRLPSHRNRISTVALMVAIAILASAATWPAAGEPNDDPTTGVWAEDGSVFLDRVRLSADDPDADPADWYRVNLTAGATELDLLRIRVNLTRDGGDPYLVWASIHDPDGALLQEVKATSYPVKTAAHLCHRTGVYLVQVYTYTRFDVHYRLEFNITQRANVTDGDDTLDQATFLEPPVEVTGHLHGVLDPFDHYAVNVTRDATHYEYVEVRLAPSPGATGTMDLDLFLLVLEDGVPREVSSSTSNASREVAYYGATVENVTVYIRCHAYGGVTDYNLTVTLFRTSDDGNNNMDQADEVFSGTSRNDSLNTTDRLDFFKVLLIGGDILWVNVSAHDYDPARRKPNFNIYLFDPSERIINWSHSYDPLERVSYQVPMGDGPAEYIVLVTFFDRSPSDGLPAYGNYTINILVDHAPRVIADLPIELEEDTAIELPLATVVEDPETPFPYLDIAVLDGGDVAVEIDQRMVMDNIVDFLDITAVSNFTGMTWFSLRVTDDHRPVVLTIPVNVTPVPDAPALVHPAPVLELEEDTTLTVDLSTIIVDGDGEPLAFNLSLDEGSPLNGSTLAGHLLTLVPGPDFFGDAQLTVVAEDPTGLSASISLDVSVLAVHDAPRLLVAEPNVTAKEDERGIEVELSTILWDPDGEVLTFEVEPTEHVSFILLGDLLVMDLEEDYTGPLSLSITGVDEAGASVSFALVVTILETNDPPRVTSATPEDGVELSEGDAVTFVVTATDPEGAVLTYTWFINGEAVPGEELPRFELVTDHDSQDIVLVTVRVSDGEAETRRNWSLTVENVNRAPTLTVKRPRDGATFEEGANIVFEAEVGDPDGEALSVEWLVADDVIGTGKVFTTSALEPGSYSMTVQVTDPHGSRTVAVVRFEVEEAAGISGDLALAIVAVVIIAGIALAAWSRTRGA